MTSRCIAISVDTNTVRMGSHTGASESDRSVIPEYIPAGTIALANDGSITALNDLAADLLGREPEAIVGKLLADFLSDESARRLEGHLIQAMGGERPARCELDLRDDSGHSSSVLIQTVTGPGGRSATAYRAVIVDISSYVKDIRDADRRRMSAERVARSKTDFLARLSHEIRSALASMIGFADLLVDTVPDANREITEIIRDSGRHILDTLKSVMDLARVEFENGDFERSNVDVVSRVRRRIKLFEKLAAGRSLDVVFRAESETAVARLNVTFLDRVLHNLVDNAIKYTPDGRVEVSVEQREGRVWIYVADTGVGMRSEFMPRLFSPFEREKRDVVESSEGVGLGLAITKYLVELMGGNITVCSTIGEGSTFTVSFPALDVPSESEPDSRTEPR